MFKAKDLFRGPQGGKKESSGELVVWLGSVVPNLESKEHTGSQRLWTLRAIVINVNTLHLFYEKIYIIL